MTTFSPVFSKIVDSSVWDEPYHVRILWMTILALKDADQAVRYDAYGLRKRSNLNTLEEVQDALRVLSSPDTKRPGQPHEGRRIEATEDGWLVLNGLKYESAMREISRRVYKARKQREYREKNGHQLPRSTPTAEEQRQVREFEEGTRPAHLLGELRCSSVSSEEQPSDG